MLKALASPTRTNVPKMRSIAVVLLTLLLLCGTSWTAVCGLTCQLEQTKQLCASPATTHAGMSADCEHCRGASDAAGTVACSTMDCGQAILQQARTSEDGSHALIAPGWITIALIAPARLSGAMRYGWCGTPPNPVPTLTSSLVSLRI
jgi:hypothetical protein